LPDKKVAMVEAMRDLNQSLKLNERCAPAHYFIGQLHKLTGDAATALKHFKRCVSTRSAARRCAAGDPHRHRTEVRWASTESSGGSSVPWDTT
jgi:hypothetical protein